MIIIIIIYNSNNNDDTNKLRDEGYWTAVTVWKIGGLENIRRIEKIRKTYTGDPLVIFTTI